MFTADQLVAHAVGDYILQSDWMATRKTSSSVAAAAHAICYTLPFLLITQAPAALAVICGTHFVIDRWRLARFVVWLKNGARAVQSAPPDTAHLCRHTWLCGCSSSWTISSTSSSTPPLSGG